MVVTGARINLAVATYSLLSKQERKAAGSYDVNAVMAGVPKRTLPLAKFSTNFRQRYIENKQQ